MRMFWPAVFLVTALLDSRANCHELCGLEPPTKEGGSCSGGGGDGAKESAADAKSTQTLAFEGSEEVGEVEAKLIYRKLPFTNDLDWSIRERLDAADELITEKPEKAIEMFQEILATHPDSVRSHYALTRSMQFINTTEWKEEKKANHAKEIHNRFKQLLRRGEGEIPDPIFHAAAHQGLLHAAERNDTGMKVELLQLALSSPKAAKNEKFHELLVHEFIQAEAYEEALEAVDIAIEEFHLSKHFKFLKGLILKKLDRKKEANVLLRSVDADPNDAFIFGSDIIELCYELSKRGREEDVDMIFKEASKIHLFLSRYQRPLEVIPDLESKPVWSLEQDVGLSTHDEEVTMLNENLADIIAEVAELRKNESVWTKNNAHFVASGGSWEEFPLYSWGKRRKYQCSLAPKTCDALKKFPAASKCSKCTIKFNVLAPKTHVRAHTGPTNARLRLHVTLKAPAGGRSRIRVGKNDIHKWGAPGQMFVFDDSFEHELWNEDDKEERIVLSIDLPHPDVKSDQQGSTFSEAAKSVYLFY